MQLKRRNDILKKGGVERHPWFKSVCEEIETAIAAIVSPTGSDRFIINPTKKANGVRPIKIAFQNCLSQVFGWKLESLLGIPNTGKVDALRQIPDSQKRFAVEWETGNVSSSHRAINKIALGILEGKLIGGALVVPSGELYKFLTDRVGSYREISTYFPMWGKLDYSSECIISVFEVEHDASDLNVPIIKKGKDGMSQGLVTSRRI